MLTLLVGVVSGSAQTYQVGPDPGAKPNEQAGKPGQSAPAQPVEPQLGWGSNIGNARLARAAQLALQQGNHGLALDYARRATQGAPNDPQLWFLLGYAARLDGKYGPSADAYQHGLKLGGSIDGLSGLAQTYMQMGRNEEAEKLLRQVIAASPNRRNDLAALGELYTRSGNYTGAIEWLGRAERIEPAAQTELLLAVNYQHTSQMDLASRYLQLAKSKAPGNPDILRSLSGFYRSTNDYPKAIDALLEIKNPKPDVLAELAFTYGLGGRPEDSARVYVQAANLLPKDLNLQLSAAQAQVSIGSIGQAKPFLDRAAKLDPHYYRLHAIRGEIAQIEDQVELAAQEYSTAVSNIPAAPPEGNLYAIQIHMTLEALYKALDEPALSDKELAIAQKQIAPLDEKGITRAPFLRLRALIKMNAGELDSALADMTESLALTPKDPNSLQLDGDLLVKMGRTDEAIVVFKKVLAIDPRSRFALTSLGYASRSAGDEKSAETYFKLLATDYPNSYVPFLALGDLYTAGKQYKIAQDNYAQAYKLAPKNSVIVAGGMNAAIEDHNLPLAGEWQKRVTDRMANVPQVLREEERYFSFMNDPKRSAEIGRQAIKLAPKDREIVIYLGYDLLHLEQYDELEALTDTYQDAFPKDADIPLLRGYVDKNNGDLEEAAASFTEALKRDPNVITAYTNRGFVYNDLGEPALAEKDFEESIRRDPKNAEAHMGLAFAELNLHHASAAIKETEVAESIAGDGELIHIIRATAYGRLGRLTKSADEYRAALKFDPNDGALYLGLGNVLFAQRRFNEAITELTAAQQHLPEDASIYALMARAHASLDQREETLKDVALAEQYAAKLPVPAKNKVTDKVTLSDIYIATGEAFSTLGDQAAAMDRFGKALDAPNSNRVSVRLAIARLMAQQDRTEDAQRQVALAQMEVAAGDTQAISGPQFIEAANIFQQVHEYQLSETYLERAKAAGAPDASVRIAMANTYLAIGETRRAAAELAAVKQTDDGEVDYQYLLAEASLYRQEHRSTDALATFARAASDAGEDQTAQQSLLSAGADEGFRVTPKISLLSNVVVQPIFEDSTIYVLDSKLDSPAGPIPVAASTQLPLPRSSLETNWLTAFHLHLNHLPTNGGFFQIRNARGTISVPATNSIVHRNTTDYSLNFGLDPTVHIGNSVVTFNSGVQGTLRRDSLSPVQLNQNLFRGFTYFTTSSFYNVLSVNGYISGEFGPFTDSDIHEHAVSGAVNFRVGAPWSKTALITGWGSNKQVFNSNSLGNSQNFYTSAYIGLDHRFSEKLSAEVLLEDLRAWRVVPFSPIHSAIAQAIRPAATVDYAPNKQWSFQASTTLENTRGFHVYDITQNGIAVSYVRPLERSFSDKSGEMKLRYPIKFTGGIREETFYNFTNGHGTQFQPYVSLTIF